MRYFVLVKGQAPQTPPPAELMQGIDRLGREATESGALLDTAGFLPGTGARVSAVAGELSVSDGPLTEAKELISYAVYDVRSKDEAIEWTRRFMELNSRLWPGWEGDADVIKILGEEDFPVQP